MRNLILKPFHGFCENLHHRKFPAIQYVVTDMVCGDWCALIKILHKILNSVSESKFRYFRPFSVNTDSQGSQLDVQGTLNTMNNHIYSTLIKTQARESDRSS